MSVGGPAYWLFRGMQRTTKHLGLASAAPAARLCALSLYKARGGESLDTHQILSQALFHRAIIASYIINERAIKISWSKVG